MTPAAKEHVGLLIGSVRRKAKQAVGMRSRKYGLSPLQFWTLATLHEEGDVSLRKLAAVLRIDEPTTSRVVSALTRQKLAEAKADPDDRRCTCIRLTPSGRKLAVTLRRDVDEFRASMIRGVSSAEQDALRRTLQKIIANLDGVLDGDTAVRKPR